ncbi:MAG: hypothetical protein R2822_20685 [Spirosomataceae bacterium]
MQYNYTLSAVNRLHNESSPTKIISISTSNQFKTIQNEEAIVESKPSKSSLPSVQPFAPPVEASKERTEEEQASTDDEKNNSEELLQVFPNPFNQQISIRYRLVVDAEVSLYVYDARGTRVGALVVNQQQEAGGIIRSISTANF